MSPLDAARAALAEREGPACDALLFDDPDPAYRCRRRHGHDGEHGRGGDLAEHLRAALAEVDRMTAEIAGYRDDLLSAERAQKALRQDRDAANGRLAKLGAERDAARAIVAAVSEVLHEGSGPDDPSIADAELPAAVRLWIDLAIESTRQDASANALRAVAEVVQDGERVRRAEARVAELEEAARWRPASERPPVTESTPGSPVITLEIRVRASTDRGFILTEGWIRDEGPRPWCTPRGHCDDADILGWRPLGAGPEVTRG